MSDTFTLEYADFYDLILLLKLENEDRLDDKDVIEAVDRQNISLFENDLLSIQLTAMGRIVDKVIKGMNYG